MRRHKGTPDGAALHRISFTSSAGETQALADMSGVYPGEGSQRPYWSMT
jgi:hypothetical protein